MADDELRWRRQHVHEANVVSFGHFSTGRYDEVGREWSFLRDPNFDSSSPDGQSPIDQFRVLHDYVLVDARDVSSTGLSNPGSCGYPRSLELAASRYRSKTSVIPVTDVLHRGQTTASLYGPLAQYDHNIRGSALAFVSGHVGDQLSISPLERTNIRLRSLSDNLVELAVPAVSRRVSVFWQSSIGSILQLDCSASDPTSKTSGYLAVRCAFATHIFEAVALGQADGIISSTSRSAFDATREPVLTLPESVTGGSSHADCAWRPDDAKQIGLVDVQGNWGIWSIHGRNAHTAKVLYQAQLQCSGKLFSWSEKSRPDQTGLYFDGWHKIVWTSSDGKSINRVLVCNRQLIRMFDLSGAETSRLDPRLGHRKHKAYILDVKVLRLKVVIVLTTTSVCVFDSSKTDWKDKNRSSSVAMICAVDHSYSPYDLELSMALAEHESLFLLMLYTKKAVPPSLRKLKISESSSGTSIAITDSVPLYLSSLRGSVSSITLRPLEALVVHSDEEGIPCLFSMVVSFENGSIKAFIIDFGIRSEFVSQVTQSSDLVRLPPKKPRTRTKSSLYVDDRDDLLDFVEPNVYRRSPQTADIPQQVRRQHEGKRRHLNEFALTRIYQYLIPNRLNENNVNQALGQILEVLSAISSDELDFTAGTLMELSPPDNRIEDVDADSTRIEEFHTELTRRYSHSFQTVTIPKHSGRSLLDTYEELFQAYIESLPAAVPGRIRLNRERQLRDVALDLNLASCVIIPNSRSEPHTAQSPSSQPRHSVEDEQAFHSDPLQGPIAPIASSPEPRIVATQGQSQDASAITPPPTVQQSLIQSAISRLSAYTPVKPPSNLSHADLSTTDSIIHPILAHLPPSPTTSPNTYNYTATEFDLSVSYHAEHATAAEREAERKRADKISRARDKAAKRQKVVNERSMIPSIGTVFAGSESGPAQLGAAMAGHVLPVRGVQSSQAFGGEAGSSQSVPGISMTQPEAGAFGQRRAKAKGKNKRRAGF